MKLTGRQRAFLSKFLELYRQTQKPLHYTDVAEAFGVAKITAYDMLRLLEQHGLVRSEYVLRGKGQGAGRSTVVCTPTTKAQTLFTEQVGATWDRAEWDKVTANILDALHQQADYQNLLDEILTQLSERTTPLLYTAHMATAVILNLLLVEEELSASALIERLKALGLPGEVGLNALSGLTVGLSFVERANRHVTDKLLSATRFYQHSLGRLSAEGKRHLVSFVRDVMHAVGT
jgi:Mn-dependent DtxR family transcriptional regulator